MNWRESREWGNDYSLVNANYLSCFERDIAQFRVNIQIFGIVVIFDLKQASPACNSDFCNSLHYKLWWTHTYS